MLSFSSMLAIKWESVLNSYPVLHKSDSDHYLFLTKGFSCIYLLPEVFRDLLLIGTKPIQIQTRPINSEGLQATGRILKQKPIQNNFRQIYCVMSDLYDKVKHNMHCNSCISQKNTSRAHSISYCIPITSNFFLLWSI